MNVLFRLWPSVPHRIKCYTILETLKLKNQGKARGRWERKRERKKEAGKKMNTNKNKHEQSCINLRIFEFLNFWFLNF